MRKLLNVAAALAALVVPPATTAHAAPTQGVGTASYSIGDLTGVVHYPKNLAGHKYPVVLMSHGLWITCADKKAWEEQDYEKLAAWPCAAGTPEIPSYRGYDYAGTALAGQGMIVISIDANSVINLIGQEQDEARAALINRHLRIWQQLSATGGGPLAGKLPVNFKGHADLMNVGLLGHSRGGRGTLFEAADVNQKNWPAGVRIKAVVPLAAAEPYAPDDNPDNPEYDNYRITNIPVASFVGTCDGAVDGHLRYLGAHNKQPYFEYTVRGANHDFYNTQWSPSSGQVGAYDDAPASCTDKRLSENRQRDIGLTYLTAFYRRYLLGDPSGMPLLTGLVRPFPVDVRADLG